jgi:uncharacterized membrane protein
MARWFSIMPAITFKGRKFKGLRGWAGKPTHPPLTDFPIVAYVLAAVFDLISYSKGEGNSVARDFFVSGTHVIIAGAIVSLPTALTGFWDWLKSAPKHTQARRTANWHMTVMFTVTAIVIINIIMRLAQWEEGHATLSVLILSLTAGGLVSFGAAYGGSLVYDYEFNVEQTYGGVWEESESDIYPGETSPRE